MPSSKKSSKQECSEERKHRKKSHKKERKESSSSSSSSSDEEIEVKVIEIVKEEKKDCNDDRKDCKEKRKHRKSRKDKDCKEKQKDSSDSSSDDECDNLEEIYCYYKKHLLRDPCLMIAGSDSYADLYNTVPQNIPINTPLLYTQNDNAIKAVEYIPEGGNVFVRESGLYLVNYGFETNEPAQFALYINNELQPDTVTGTNSGSGQLLSSALLALKKNDSITVRNHTSSVIGGVVTIIQYAGGTATQASTQLTLFKVAPYPDCECGCEYREDYKCHEKREKLFHCLEKKLLEDPSLMVDGFDAYGTFYSTTSQTIAVESPAIFSLCSDSKCLGFTPGSSTITIEKAGVYSIYAAVNTIQAAQFAIFVNGSPLPSSVVGVNKGANVLTTRIVTELKCKDVVTWVNHTSAIPAVTSQNPGGLLSAIDVLINLVRIAPCRSFWCDDNKKCQDLCCKEEKFCQPEDVKEFKEFLLHRRHLQIDGAKYISLSSTTQQNLNIGNSVIWKRKTFAKRIQNIQGKPEIWICQDGAYELVAALNSSQPDQFTLFVNGKPWLKTTTGKDSGAASTSLTYNLNLCKGDCLTWNNYQSLVNPVVSSSNAGGTEVGANAFFIILRLGDKSCDQRQCPQPTTTTTSS